MIPYLTYIPIALGLILSFYVGFCFVWVYNVRRGICPTKRHKVSFWDHFIRRLICIKTKHLYDKSN